MAATATAVCLWTLLRVLAALGSIPDVLLLQQHALRHEVQQDLSCATASSHGSSTLHMCM